ncbi:MAG: histidine kinase [Saprospiraceae bacterium]
MQTFVQKNRVPIMHMLFWLAYFSFFFYQISNHPKNNTEETPFIEIFLNAFSHTVYLATVAYLNYFIILPRYLSSKKGWNYILEFTLMAVIITLIYVPMKRLLTDGYTYHNGFYYSYRFIFGSFVTSIFVAVFVASLRFFTEWQELDELKTKYKNEKLTAELKFLKNQINPHFLFNTLNNLYALAYSNSPQTTEVISKLSQMMRYMVYDCNNDYVPLSKEIEYINNYIALEKLRLNNNIPIEFTVTGNPHDKKIMPLLLIPFLENAFKHGVSNTHDSWVKAQLECNGKSISLHVSNSKSTHNGSAASTNSGVGLENVKRRLMLNYPEKHKINLVSTDDEYIANLEVQLN